MKLAAFICETRPLPNLIQVINAHLKHLPADTDLFIMHGREHRFLKQIYPNAHRTEVPSMSISEYNQLLTSPSFWEQFLGYDYVLVFQIDSMILRLGIQEFIDMEVDYIGASWGWNAEYPGNGGFSLRNPKVMHEICTRFPWNGNLNEDHWLCMHMHEFKVGKMATIEQADKFSVEQKYILGSWGYHAPCTWMTPEQCEQIKNQYL